MIFQSLILENFGPYSDRQVLTLTPTEISPIILIGGMNGGGKTTIMDAIRLVLYGQRAQCSNRGSLAYADFLTQCIHRQAPPGSKTAVELIFRHSITGEPTEYHVCRSWQNQIRPKENLEIFIRNIVDGEPISLPDPTLTKLWDEHIEELLPLGISNLFLFDGEQIKELAEQDTPPPDVITAIQSLLGLELSDRLAVDLKIMRDRKAKKMATSQELTDFETLENAFREKEDQRKLIVEKISHLENTLRRAQTDVEMALQFFQMRGGDINNQRTQLEVEQRQLQQQLDNDRDQLRKLAAQSLPLQWIRPLLQRAEQNISQDVQQQYHQIKTEILAEFHTKLLEFAHQQKWSKNQLKSLHTFLQKEQTLEIQATSAFLSWGVHQSQLQFLQTLLSYLLPDQLSHSENLLQHLKMLEFQLDNNDRQLAVAAPPEEFEQLTQQLENANQRLLSCNIQKSELEQQKKGCETELNQLKDQLSKYSKMILDRQNDERLIQSIDRVNSTLVEFRKKLKIRKIDRLESAVTESFRYLLRKTDFVSRVMIDLDTFSLSLYDTQGQELPKHRLSAGEKQLLATAFLWGLARVSGRHLPIAIDTPLGRLDSSHRKNLVDRYFPTASHQVLLLSTDTEITQTEVISLREAGTIAMEYLLEYDPQTRHTHIKPGYFW
jgi:DNA sulfur modification protein DndD